MSREYVRVGGGVAVAETTDCTAILQDNPAALTLRMHKNQMMSVISPVQSNDPQKQSMVSRIC